MRWALVSLVAACLWAASVRAQSSTCIREPLGTNAPKTPGSNNFTIKISGNPAKYVPGDVYTVSLLGWRQEYSVKKFTGFLLLVEPSRVPRDVYGPQSVGMFQLYGDALTLYSEDCPNAITQSSSAPKSEIQVLWTAPPAGSGCVIFRATVVEARDVWYMDDGGLTKELCEEEQDNPDTQPTIIDPCCACDEAKYEVTFEGLWSRHTHPKDFPNNEWLTHFSDIIGASHSKDYMVWEYGKEASDGLQQVAEWGSTRRLESELKRQSNHIRTIIKARGLWYPNVNGKTFAVFRVDNRHHLMSLVSMLGPTPDWIVGVSALELCLTNCSWVTHKTLNLYPYDAGTDSGVTYDSASVATLPKGKIRRITSTFPNDPASPFYDPTGKPMKPLARLTITRQRVYEKSCSDTDILRIDEPEFEVSDEDADRPECVVSEWSQFSPCSVSCGKGIRSRTRNYLMPQKAQMMMCKRQLEENEMCAADELYCEDSPDGSFAPVPDFDPRICTVSEWSPWTPCSTTCGKGHRMRSRRYLDRMGRKKCDTELVEKEMCVVPEAPTCDYDNVEDISEDCAVTPWTDFTPCSVTCGKGVTARTRAFLIPSADHSHCNVDLRDERECMAHRSVCFDPSEAEEVCMLKKEVGPCRGYFPRWYYDPNHERCMQFTFGGCRGNRNNFEEYEQCTKLCEVNKAPGGQDQSQPINPRPPPSRSRLRPQPDDRGQRVDCKVTDWSRWSPCSATCGDAIKEKHRRIVEQNRNGGRRCPRRLVKKRDCKVPRCPTDHFNGLQSLSQRRETEPTATTTTTPPPVPHQPETEAVPLSSFDPDEEYISPSLYNPHVGPSYLTDDDHDHHEHEDVENCVLSEWGPWSPCTHSCGPEALQQRSRLVVMEARNGGTPCGDTRQRRYCTLPPCPRPRIEHFPWLEWRRP
ncbi:spondin-1-like isoform X1 [Portunus trituberculatus]|uniref:spondin-1-like isoform X1 n=1 Tax=Portunus trituberculatus TaxID=210409 RepID=UPI001E1CEFE3|nr:spondin-1-like isoform X1 [Portunus trituberculatus]